MNERMPPPAARVASEPPAAPPPRWRWDTAEDAAFVRKTLIFFAIAALALTLWVLSDVLLLAFGAVLVAVLLHALAAVLARYARVPERWSLTVASVVVFGLLIAALALFGTQIRVQISGIAERLPLALNTFTKELGLGEVTAQLPQMLGMGPGGGFVSRIAGIGGAVLGGLADFLLVVIAGIYIAASPRTYRRGLVQLFPPSQHERVESSLAASGEALKLWLVAQLIAMTAVGVLSSLAFWWIGLPSPFALGLIAGLADFIPFVGPIIGAMPAVLLAFTQDGATVLWTVLAVLVIQQIEGNVIFPLVERRVVSLPPALALFAIVAGGVLFGTLGMIFGFPLAVVTFVLVKKLYVRETLGEATPVPGEEKGIGIK
jgi:predicted PurR-regulated permease PerM